MACLLDRTQWKKDVKARYSIFTADKERLGKFLNNRQEEIDEEMKRKRLEAKREQQQEEHRLSELRLRHEEHEQGNTQKAGIGERYTFKYSETTEIENNAVQGNAYRLGEV